MVISLRKTFTLPSKELTHWFPGHMGKGMKQMEAKLGKVDCIIEVHDSRIPFSGRNPLLHDTITKHKPHILVMNKVDLITKQDREAAGNKLKRRKEADEVIFTYCKNERDAGVRKIVPALKGILADKLTLSAETGTVPSLHLMVIGVPNVGKSSLINMLRAKHLNVGKAAAVGAVAGVTRSLTEKIKICEDPKIYLFDTPGIMIPNIRDVETGMKLAACATLQDHLVGPDYIADYILYWMNRRENYSYVDVFELGEPSDNIMYVLTKIATARNSYLQLLQPDGQMVKRPDFKNAADLFIRAFRSGKFGKIMLDSDLL